MSAPLVVVSNRGPAAFAWDADGVAVAERAGGGLASTLGAGIRTEDAIWVAAAVSEADRAAAQTVGPDRDLLVQGYRLRLVILDQAIYRAAYDVVANQTLWFWHHHLFDQTRRPRLDRRFGAAWEAYRDFNAAMAGAADGAAAPGATVLIHDYHLALTPALLRSRRPDLRIVHFTHTPFVDPSTAAVLPDEVVNELLDGMAGADTCGFHSARWADAFSACWHDRRGASGRPSPQTFVAPAAADHAEVAAVARSEACAVEEAWLAERIGERACITRVDRIEPSKNLLRGFWAFAELLETEPTWRNRACLVAIIYPSREDLAEYRGHRNEVESAVEQVNRAFGTPDWTPIVVDTEDAFPRSVAALRRADVLLVNPIRDGLNLVAYEAPAINERNAPLVLSREAGAWDELGRAGAIGVNPFDVSGTARALAQALTMPDQERAERADRLRAAATVRTPADWLARQLEAAKASPGR